METDQQEGVAARQQSGLGLQGAKEMGREKEKWESQCVSALWAGADWQSHSARVLALPCAVPVWGGSLAPGLPSCTCVTP